MALVPSLFTPGGDPFLMLRREMNRLFDDALGGAHVGGGHVGGGQGGTQSGLLLAPNIDVSETDAAVRIQAELPGVTEKDVELSLDNGILTLRAEKKQRREEREGVHISERSYGTFQRSLRLPYHVSPDQVQAHFENGVLGITVPKMQQQERNRRIPVQGARPQTDKQQREEKSVSVPRTVAGQSRSVQDGQAAIQGHVASIDAAVPHQ